MSVNYNLDARQSRFVVKVRATGLLGSLGHNPTIAIRRFSGWLNLDPVESASGSFQMIVAADSLEVMDDITKKDRQEIERQVQAEVLETRHFPEIRFESREISAEKEGDDLFQLQIAGDLSLHGVTRNKRIDTRLRVRADLVRVTGSFTLLQSDYKIKRVTALAGALTVKDELAFEFEITGVKEES